METLLSVIALITAAVILRSEYTEIMAEGGPIGVFSAGIGTFVEHLGIPQKAGMTFAALAISAFALTTLDTATRLGRFMFQEFFEKTNGPAVLYKNRYTGTLVTIAAAAFFTFTGTRNALWPLFGAANQLLASLTLLAVTVWLTKMDKKSLFVRIPMYFMFCVTITALGVMVVKNWMTGNAVLLIFSSLLFGIAVTLIIKARQSLRALKT
ncbi:MAG: carbon starvation CstA 5TM domain-containing protein [candidate division KSB1 bacterium]|nr:carbon starvation CstA 5TM domain-containing protein [candidate division KSB1 bacterium]